MARPTLPLKLTQDGYGKPALLLGGVDITQYVAADGLRIEYQQVATYVGGGGYSVPEVTITFAPGTLSLDLDVELLQHLLDAAKAGL